MADSAHIFNLDTCKGRKVLIGITGAIACYKMCHVVSRMTQAGAAVTVAMTDAATRFVTPLTFQALTGKPVYTSQWEHIESQDPQHISLARSLDLMLIAPCSMNMLATLAAGRTDDVVSLIASAVDRTKQPTLLAPSMNEMMWNQPATQRNLAQLREDGFEVIEPESGWQACRTVGVGRLPEPDAILAHLVQRLSQLK